MLPCQSSAPPAGVGFPTRGRAQTHIDPSRRSDVSGSSVRLGAHAERQVSALRRRTVGVAMDPGLNSHDYAVMRSPVLTLVSASVTEGDHERLISGFRELLKGGFPDGLLRTELLQGPEDRWRIQTLWRDRAALEAMRAGPEPPAAPALFRSLGSEPSLEIWEVVSGSTA